MKILRTASVGFNFTGSYKKQSSNADVVPVHSDKGGYRPCEYPP